VIVLAMDTKKTYRAACRQASNSNIRRASQTFTNLHRSKHVKYFWNMVRSYKRGNTGGDEDISIQNLRDHFMVKFCDSDVYREAIDERYSSPEAHTIG
jgi:hypothetical protein